MHRRFVLGLAFVALAFTGCTADLNSPDDQIDFSGNSQGSMNQRFFCESVNCQQQEIINMDWLTNMFQIPPFYIPLPGVAVPSAAPSQTTTPKPGGGDAGGGSDSENAEGNAESAGSDTSER